MRFLNKYLILSALFFTLFELKAQIKPILVENDTSIINKSSFKVYKLFDEKDIKAQKPSFGAVGHIKIYQKNDTIVLIADNQEIKITSNGTLLSKIGNLGFDLNNNKSLKEIKQSDYKCTRKDKYLAPPEYIERREKTKVNNYNLIVDVKKPLGCGSCGNNPVTIKDKNGKTLLFKKIQNLTIFECDIDNDKKNEIYVASYYACGSKLVVYQVIE